MEIAENLPEGETTLVSRSGVPKLAAPPALIADAGHAAHFAWDEFFYGAVRNPHTRRTYGRAVRRFFRWCEFRGLALHNIAPAHVGRYLDGLPDAPSSQKVYLAAIRRLFDLLVTRHAVLLNPAASVRGDRLTVVEGRTPEITVQQARRPYRASTYVTSSASATPACRVGFLPIQSAFMWPVELCGASMQLPGPFPISERCARHN